MAFTPTQIDPYFQKALGRNATDYEVSQYSNKSTQDLAGIPSFYNTLNKNNSLVDYLKYTGQDPSATNLTALGQKYGINGIGTAQGNTALLKALQTGSAPAKTPPTPNAQNGTVSAAATTTPSVTPPTPTPTPSTNTGQNASDQVAAGESAAAASPSSPQAQGAPGSIATAAATTNPDGSPAYVPDPALATAYSNYTSVQAQIQQIDDAVSGALQAKKDQVVQSGGVVDEAQLMGEVQAENAPLLAQRKELVTQQANYGKTYQGLLTVDRQNRSDFNAAQNRAVTEQNNQANQSIKTAQLGINQEKAVQSGISIQKVPQYDQYGNQTTPSLVLVNKDGTTTPLSTTSTGALTPASVAAITSNPTGTTSASTIQSLSTPQYATSFIKNADGPTDENQNVQVPGTALTIGSLYQQALAWMAAGGKYTVSGLRSGKSISAASNAAVSDKGSAMLQDLGITLPAYAAAYKANSQALDQQMKTFSQLSVNEGAATKNFNTLLKLSQAKDSSVFTVASPLLNNWIQTGILQSTGNADVNNFLSQLTLTMTEYAKVITGQTGGAAVSDSARSETQKLLDGGLSYDSIKSFYDNVASVDITNRVSSAKDAINNIVGGINAGSPGTSTDGNSGAPAPTTPTVIDPSQIPDGYYQASDGLLYKK